MSNRREWRWDVDVIVLLLVVGLLMVTLWFVAGVDRLSGGRSA
jgi:hypothetical protein